MELCSIASGSSGNCIYAGTDDCHLLIDAGISGKRIEDSLKKIDLSIKDIQAVLITHEHTDHISGLGVLARKYEIPIYAVKKTADAVLKSKIVGKMDGSLFHYINPEQTFFIKDIMIEPIPVSHDAAEPVAYKLTKQDKTMAVITDLGNYDDYIVEKLKQLDVLFLEANHNVRMLQAGSYPYSVKQRILSDLGHLSNEVSGQLLSEVLHDNLKYIFLGHLSKKYNSPELAYETVRLEVELADNAYKGNDFPILVANREEMSQKIKV